MVHDPLRAQPAPEGQVLSPGEGERIAKALARAGVASRREVERLIEAGRVAVNGRVLSAPGVRIAPGDILTVDGEVVDAAEPARLFRYHKPAGLVTSHADPQGRPTVFDALPKTLPRLISVGRLDLNTEGLLLLTNDGELARALELPATALIRRYRARAHGRITQDKLDTLKNGVTIEGVRYGAVEAKIDKAKEGPQGANVWITLTLAEGKNREVRRVLESLGLKVNRLLRLSYGPFALGNLDVGEVEEVGPRVIREQLAEHIEEANLPTGDRPQWKAPKTNGGGGGRRAGANADGTVAMEAPPERPAKPIYKAGWAKPKSKPVAHARAAGGKAPARKPKSPTGAPHPLPQRANSLASDGSKRRAGPALTTSKPSESLPASGRLGEKRGRKPSPSRPRNSPARPPAPRPRGGPKPRG